jgi:hypothetical protein
VQRSGVAMGELRGKVNQIQVTVDKLEARNRPGTASR